MPSFDGGTSTPFLESMASSSIKTPGFITVPGPIRRRAPKSTPDGIRCSLYVLPSATTVCPALSPPWNLATISYFEAIISTIFPLPSSPNCAPVIIVNILPSKLIICILNLFYLLCVINSFNGKSVTV